MTSKTKTAAIEKLKGWKTDGFVYQYEKGHWDCCTADSPVGQDLARYGMVSLDLGIKPKKFEIVCK